MLIRYARRSSDNQDLPRATGRADRTRRERQLIGLLTSTHHV